MKDMESPITSTTIEPIGQTIENIVHHRMEVNGTELHYVTAGESDSTVLLVHGFPESWWAFHAVIPRLAEHHRIVAVDLRGFGDSRPAEPGDDHATFAEDLHALVEGLGLGPVHAVVQDLAGMVGFRLAADHPGDLRSLTAIEAGLPGYGLEALADVTHGGAWYPGLLAAPGAPEAFLAGREEALLGDFLFPAATVAVNAPSDRDIAELARGYRGPAGWSGARALYTSLLRDGEALRAIAGGSPLTLPMLAVDRDGSDFTLQTFAQVHSGDIVHRTIPGVGHYVALEAPEALARILLQGFANAEGKQGTT